MNASNSVLIPNRAQRSGARAQSQRDGARNRINSGNGPVEQERIAFQFIVQHFVTLAS